MSKERLEEIKGRVLKNKVHIKCKKTGETRWGHSYELLDKDYEWLVEQAGIGINTNKDKHTLIKSNIALNKRVQELEQDVREWEIVNESWEEINTQIVEQNKRYREVIEEAIEYANSPKILTSPAGIEKILSKALEDEE